MESEKVIKSLDLNKALKPHENKWVALSKNKKEVAASGATLQEVITYIKKNNQNQKDFSFAKVLPFNMNYAPGLS